MSSPPSPRPVQCEVFGGGSLLRNDQFGKPNGRHGGTVAMEGVPEAWGKERKEGQPASQTGRRELKRSQTPRLGLGATLSTQIVGHPWCTTVTLLTNVSATRRGTPANAAARSGDSM
jgi:hypothetical protein